MALWLLLVAPLAAGLIACGNDRDQVSGDLATAPLDAERPAGAGNWPPAEPRAPEGDDPSTTGLPAIDRLEAISEQRSAERRVADTDGERQEDPDAAAPSEATSGEPRTEELEEPEPAPLDGRVIALDPGHNGGNFDAPEEINEPVDAGRETKPCNTAGAVTDDGYRESTFNLELSVALRAELEERGAQVVMTREDDDGVGPCIDERGTFGQTVGADVLVSIHADGADPSGHGFHVIRPAGWEEQSDQVVAASEHLAGEVRDRLVEVGFDPSTYVGSDGVHPRDDLGTLNLAEVPAVLLEAGNMHNPDDIAVLRSEEGQERMARALADALERYFAR